MSSLVARRTVVMEGQPYPARNRAPVGHRRLRSVNVRMTEIRPTMPSARSRMGSSRLGGVPTTFPEGEALAAETLPLDFGARPTERHDVMPGVVLIKAGTLDGTVAQYPYAMGLMGIEACQAATTGKTLPATPKPFGTYVDPFKSLIQ